MAANAISCIKGRTRHHFTSQMPLRHRAVWGVAKKTNIHWPPFALPRPWEPVIDGTDIFAAAVKAAYAKANYSVTFLDDWASHHVHFGNVHCGTNSARETTRKSW
ncbi:protein-arginine deiminase (PAD) domain-containing protein [Hirsutella rhossiliensis]|uniref:Protein-arginine deiminase (PAD) domain-containing protein n=1 Tax=Hirsutella rhossiliensis TaxID=111463 RepID=A0A9P8N331_9HYPO|nr:protein-arginine deiminase (PAD) domain-containing protein [Hirsutella rhossiliensis]KAH0963807.1 protein-arginine deiminase (PAD) domain-containing protein [Hirsutella rhossiliensis]